MAALQTRVPRIRLLADLDVSAARAWGVVLPGGEHAIAATFVVDRDRKIVWRHLPDQRGDWPPYDALARAATVRISSR